MTTADPEDEGSNPTRSGSWNWRRRSLELELWKEVVETLLEVDDLMEGKEIAEIIALKQKRWSQKYFLLLIKYFFFYPTKIVGLITKIIGWTTKIVGRTTKNCCTNYKICSSQFTSIFVVISRKKWRTIFCCNKYKKISSLQQISEFIIELKGKFLNNFFCFSHTRIRQCYK